MTPDPATNEFVVRSLHPGISRDQVRENTGWPMRFAETVEETPPPTRIELEALRELNARTAASARRSGCGLMLCLKTTIGATLQTISHRISIRPTVPRFAARHPDL